MTAGIPDDPSVPVFFLSYVRERPLKRPLATSMVNEAVHRFFTDLSQDVAQLVPLEPGLDPGFMDGRVEAGEVWTEELLWAVGSCQVFVALLSPAYLKTSEWCAMEWDLFAGRRTVRTAEGQPSGSTSIVPVLWAPIHGPVPPAVARIQMFAPAGVSGDTEPLYRREGVLGLHRMRRHDEFDTVVWLLARQIAAIYNAQRVQPDLRKDTTGLRRRFEGVA